MRSRLGPGRGGNACSSRNRTEDSGKHSSMGRAGRPRRRYDGDVTVTVESGPTNSRSCQPASVGTSQPDLGVALLPPQVPGCWALQVHLGGSFRQPAGGRKLRALSGSKRQASGASSQRSGQGPDGKPTKRQGQGWRALEEGGQLSSTPGSSLEVSPMLVTSHTMICHAMPLHKRVIDESLTLAQHNGHFWPFREHDTQIKLTTPLVGHSDFPVWSCSPSLLRYRLPVVVTDSGNVISSMIQRLTKSAPSHSHGDDMDQQSTAHVFLSVSMWLASVCVYHSRKRHPRNTCAWPGYSIRRTVFSHVPLVRLHVVAIRGTQKATLTHLQNSTIGQNNKR